MENFDSLISTLNTIELGELDKILSALNSVRSELERRELTELVVKLDACRDSLMAGELEAFRRTRATVVSRLGHLRSRSASGS